MNPILHLRSRVLLLLFGTLSLAAVGAAPGAGGIRIELTEPKVGNALVLTAASTPLRVAGRVISDDPLVLFMIGSNKVTPAADGSFSYDLALDAGINRVMLMAANSTGARAFLEFNVTLAIGAAVGTLEDPSRGEQLPPTPAPADPPVQVTQQQEVKEEESGPTTVKGTQQQEVKDEVPEPTTVNGTQEQVSEPPRTTKDGALSREELLGTGNQRTTGTRPTDGVQEQRSAPAGQLYALVVGVSRYRYASEQDLHYADKDAAALATFLRESGCSNTAPENVVLLQNGMARAEVIKASLDELLSRATENDRFLFYFSGHGMHDSRGQLCLLGADAMVDDPSRAWSSSVTQADLVTALGAARCKDKLLFLDACHSGRVSSGERSTGGFGNGVTVLTAAGDKESSYESDELQAGIFTHYLLQGLKGAADPEGDGRFTMVQLADYVQERTAEEASRAGHQQNPRFTAGDNASLTLCRAGSGRAEVRNTTASGSTGASTNTEVIRHEQRAGLEIITKERTTLDNLLYVNKTTGDRLRFYHTGNGGMGISASIDGDLFASNGRYPGGSTISFEEKDRTKITDGYVHLSANWDRIDISYTRSDGTQVKKRELWRTEDPSPKPAIKAQTFGAPGQTQQLEVWHVEPAWTHLSGHLGRELLILHGRRHGDILLLNDVDRAVAGSGTAMFVDQGTRLIGRFKSKEDGKEERFDLPLMTPTEGLRFNNRRFDDESNGDFLSFHHEANGWVRFDGRVADRTVKGAARVYGDVLQFKHEDGANFEPGRMLLHERGDRIMGDFYFPEPELERTVKVSVYLYRSN